MRPLTEERRRQIEDAIQEYASGTTMMVVSAKYKIDHTRLRDYILAEGVHIRTQKEITALRNGVRHATQNENGEWVKVCRECEQEKPVGKFTVASDYADGRKPVCNECLGNTRRPKDRKKYKDDPEYRKKVLENCKDNYIRHADYTKIYSRQYRYGISEDEYQKMLGDQGGVCAVCGAEDPGCTGRSWAVDHDHSCCSGNRTCGKCNRGILCQPCNAALGMAKDNPDILRKLAEYLENYAEKSNYQPMPGPNSAPPYGLAAPSA